MVCPTHSPVLHTKLRSLFLKYLNPCNVFLLFLEKMSNISKYLKNILNQNYVPPDELSKLTYFHSILHAFVFSSECTRSALVISASQTPNCDVVFHSNLQYSLFPSLHTQRSLSLFSVSIIVCIISIAILETVDCN